MARAQQVLPPDTVTDLTARCAIQTYDDRVNRTVNVDRVCSATWEAAMFLSSLIGAIRGGRHHQRHHGARARPASTADGIDTSALDAGWRDLPVRGVVLSRLRRLAPSPAGRAG